MRRFEFVEGSSSKFWEIEQTDAAVTVRYGRIGAAGTAQTKTHADAAKARVEADKLVREKVAKGYVEQGVAAGATVAAAMPKPAPASAAAVPSPVAKPADANVFEPPGALRWTAAWRRLLPDWNAPPAMPDWLTHDRETMLADEPLTGSRFANFYGDTRTPPLPVIEPDAVPAKLTPAALASASLDDWTRLMATAAQWGVYPKTSHPHGGIALYWVVRLCALWAGASTAIEAYLRQFCGPPGAGHIPDYWLNRDLGLGLADARALVASLDDAAHGRMHARLVEFAASGPQQAFVAAALSPRSADLIDTALAAFVHNTQYAWTLLLGCALSPAQIETVFAHPQLWLAMNRDDAVRLALLAAQLPPERAYAALDRLLDVAKSTEARAALAKVIRAHDNAAAMRLFVKHAARKEMRAQLDEFAQAWPALAIASAAELGDDLDKTARQWLVGFANGYPQDLARARERVGDAGRAVLDGLRRRADVEDAPLDAIPAVLRDPPWLKPRAERKPPAVELARYDAAPELVWPPGLQARWRARCGDDAAAHAPWVARHAKGEALAQWLLGEFRLPPEWLARLEAGETPAFDDRAHASFSIGLLLALPGTAGATLWTWSDPARWYDYTDCKPGLAARWGLAFLPGLLRFVQNDPVEGLTLALPFRAAALAPVAADALRNTRRARNAAQTWLLAHAALACAALLPVALRDDAAGQDAQFALRWLARNGRAAELDDGAARHGDAGRAALAHVLAFDASSLFPTRLPKLPGLWTPRSFARPQLASGGALPESCLDALGTMLAFSTLEAPYAGIAQVRDACTPSSLAAFAWDLFEAWIAAGAPSKESWAFTALAAIGGDDAARRLAPLIRAWPGEGGHARAVLGLDVLAGIGSDVALMHLNGIAQKVKFKALQQHARDRIGTIADARGLTSEALADRLVPDLGLDADGSLALDFGPRAFRVGFDEALKPFVRDEGGARLKDLPKPNQGDDAALANEATERWKALKKDARALAALQLQRLERAMVERRRWSADEFRLFLLGHPLLVHLVRRLLWTATRDGARVASFRVAEDASFADENDDAWELPGDVRVRLAHPLELDAATAAAFAQVFADYEIVQPFRQIGRETHALTADEALASTLARFEGRRIATGSVLGLEHRGWRRGSPQDAGWIGEMTRELPDELDAELALDPGMSAGDITMEPVQRLVKLTLRRRGSWNDDGFVAFGTLDAIVASELLRDVDLLTQIP
jgi:predicted DNA-binding WGR domain protein